MTKLPPVSVFIKGNLGHPNQMMQFNYDILSSDSQKPFTQRRVTDFSSLTPLSAKSNSTNNIDSALSIESLSNPPHYGSMNSIPDMSFLEQNLKPKGSNKILVFPAELNNFSSESNANFKEALVCTNTKYRTLTIGLLPTHYWSDEMTFGEIVEKFFQRKNNSNCRFSYKLFNALKLTEYYPNLYPLIGVRWITEHVFEVDKLVFGRLLGISSIDGSFFHQQGNFTSHGFVNLSYEETMQYIQSGMVSDDIDFDRRRLMYHRNHIFFRSCKEESITSCKWFV